MLFYDFSPYYISCRRLLKKNFHRFPYGIFHYPAEEEKTKTIPLVYIITINSGGRVNTHKTEKKIAKIVCLFIIFQYLKKKILNKNK